MNKKIALILALIIITGCIQEQPTTSTSTSKTSTTTSTSTSSTITTTSTTIRENNYSVEDLTGCEKAESLGEFLNDPGSNISKQAQDAYEDLKPVDHKIVQNIQAEIYHIGVGTAGGDVLKVPVIKADEKYCRFNQSNAEVMFAPIEKENAIDYLELRYITLARSQYGRDHTVIREKGKYQELVEKCPDGNLTELEEKETSQVEETERGYNIKLITHNNAGESCIFEWNVTVQEKGEINIQYIKCTIPCGNPILY